MLRVLCLETIWRFQFLGWTLVRFFSFRSGYNNPQFACQKSSYISTCAFSNSLVGFPESILVLNSPYLKTMHEHILTSLQRTIKPNISRSLGFLRLLYCKTSSRVKCKKMLSNTTKNPPKCSNIRNEDCMERLNQAIMILPPNSPNFRKENRIIKPRTEKAAYFPNGLSTENVLK